MLYYVVVLPSVLVNSHVFTQMLQGYFTGNGPQCQWNNPERSGLNRWHTTTNTTKLKTLHDSGLYCVRLTVWTLIRRWLTRSCEKQVDVDKRTRRTYRGIHVARPLWFFASSCLLPIAFRICRWCEYSTNRHTLCLIASPWSITPMMTTTVRTHYVGIRGKIMSSSCSHHFAE